MKKDEKLKKDDGGGGGVGGSKTEDVPVKIPKKIEAKKEEQEASVFEVRNLIFLHTQELCF